jgi:hypothetical protein
VVVCATTGVRDADVLLAELAVVALALATLVAAGDGPVDAGVAACTTVAALLLTSKRLPPMPKKDATLSPASRMRLPFAGCLRRDRWRVGVSPVVGVAAATLLRADATRDFPEAARRSWSRRIRSACSTSFVGSVIGLTPRACSARRLAHLVVGMALGHGA